MSESGGTQAATSSSSQNPWLDQTNFLAVGRQLFDPETQQLNRERLSRIFPLRSATYFDLSTTSVAALERMYRNLRQIWANNHPLLRKNVRLRNIERKYRAFHEYSLDVIKRLINDGSDETAQRKQLSQKSFQHLSETLRQDQQRIFHFQNLTIGIADEIDSLQSSIRALNELMENEDPIGHYLSMLVETKKKRIEVMRREMVDYERWFRGRDYRSFTDEFEERLVRTLDQSLVELVKLRDAIENTPNPLEMKYVLPQWKSLDLPEQLISLYYRLYRNLVEVTVRNKLLETLGEKKEVNERRVD